MSEKLSLVQMVSTYSLVTINHLHPEVLSLTPGMGFQITSEHQVSFLEEKKMKTNKIQQDQQ